MVSPILNCWTTCRGCGRTPALEPGVILHVDHIKAWVKRGRTTDENLQTLCDKCNLGKGDTLPVTGADANSRAAHLNRKGSKGIEHAARHNETIPWQIGATEDSTR